MAESWDMAEFFEEGRFSDITLKFGARSELPAHKLVLVQKSDYFRAMFDDKFSESAKRTIEIKDDDPIAFRGLIAYCYGLQFNGAGQYTKDGATKATEGARRMTDSYIKYQVDLYVVAQKYLVPALCTEVTDRLPAILRILLDTHEEYATQLVSIVRHIYVFHEDAAVDLRKPIIDLIVANAATWKEVSEIRQLLLDVPQLALDVLGEMAMTMTLAVPASKRPASGGANGNRSKRAKK